MSDVRARADEAPPYRYTARLANEIEQRWQDRWEEERTFWTPNPTGPLADGYERVADRSKLYVLDMFPYPSGAGLHVGHPLGYIGTDVYARYQRMTGHNVLHAMGYDAFGLPAEQYALETGQHPRVTTDQNIATMRRQLRRLGLGHDPRRGVSTTDVQYYRWTQWIFLQMFNAWYDDEQDRPRPMGELVAELEAGSRAVPDGRPWDELDALERRKVVDSYRLAYLEEVAVNWCPALGTGPANEGVPAEGRSERGNHPVYKRPLKQWMLRITKYAERLLAGLDLLDWPESIKIMQRNWIGRSEGADIMFPVEGHDDLGIRVFTTRPDTVFGATYMVLAPELDVIDEIVANEWPREAPLEWRGTFGLDVSPPPDFDGEGSRGDGPAINSSFLDGLPVDDAKRRITEWLDETGNGAGAVTYKLRAWLFSRQRYWGEPFPIVYDETGLPVALSESMLPVELPEMSDFQPRIVADDEETLPEPPLARAEQWVTVEADRGEGTKTYLRETNTMPQWAGSCWYYLRYLDPTNENRIVEREVERYWMQGDNRSGGVDLYVGGAEHAVLHLLYARFWHKFLYDLAHVSTPEPFARLFNQGTITAYEYVDDRGVYVPANEVEERDGKFFFEGKEVARQQGRMGKSRKNAVAPDEIYADYGADTLRLYEMFMGPLDASRPWNTADIVGVHRFLQRFWRNAIDEETGAIRVSDASADEETRRILHRTIEAVRADMAKLQFNTAIARLFELNNRLTAGGGGTGAGAPRGVTPMTLMLAPLAPHLAEEVWSRLGHAETLTYEPFPEPDPAYLVVEEVEIPVQIDGKVRARVKVPAGASEAEHEGAARADERIAQLLDGVAVGKVVVVPGRLVNFVTR